MSRIFSDLQLMLRRPPRQQYAAICYRLRKKHGEPEILLLTSRGTGRWVIPKGWPMAGKPSHAVAAREAFEEAGVRGVVSEEPFGHYHYQKGMKDGFSVACRVQVHTLEVKEILKDFPEKNMRRFEWVNCEEAAARVQEPELKVLFHKLAMVFRQSSSDQGVNKGVRYA
ncbi:NUDIX hydrolase [Pseudomonas sp. R2.Fl]|nr:NUDIX hydrolase [Pseudomonas sp. R2.Fl]